MINVIKFGALQTESKQRNKQKYKANFISIEMEDLKYYFV